MLWRAVLAFVTLPGVVAFAIPIGWALHSGWHPRFAVTGAAVIVAASGLLFACVREFYRAGRGTLAPWDPPQHLVTTGPYAVSRNPMYIGVAAILAGWAVFYGSYELTIYALAVACAFHVRVVLFEERWAARRFGGAWDLYRTRVPRWLFSRPRARIADA
jgi:protein-S-isoprenylcysteine O-methyltransferase Ste14